MRQTEGGNMIVGFYMQVNYVNILNMLSNSTSKTGVSWVRYQQRMDHFQVIQLDSRKPYRGSNTQHVKSAYHSVIRNTS